MIGVADWAAVGLEQPTLCSSQLHVLAFRGRLCQRHSVVCYLSGAACGGRGGLMECGGEVLECGCLGRCWGLAGLLSAGPQHSPATALLIRSTHTRGDGGSYLFAHIARPFIDYTQKLIAS